MMTPHQILIGGGALVVAGLAVHYAPSFEPTRDRTAALRSAKFGYLSGAVSQELARIPPPPAPGSAEMQRDEKARLAALKLHDPGRYAQAVLDSDRSFEATLATFSCAMGMNISQRSTPRLAHLLNTMRIDVRHAAGLLRGRYKRQQPFMAYKTETCSPKDEALVADQGSYPSARGAVGWSYALVLSELNPPKSAAILKRGRDFGESRVICGSHWQSDIDAGNELGRIVVSQLHRNPAFVSDFQAARREVAQMRSSGAKASNSCEPASVVASR